jgi:hypothetical protein
MEISIDFQAGSDRDAACTFLREGGFLSKETFGQYKSKQVGERVHTCEAGWRAFGPRSHATAIARRARSSVPLAPGAEK